MSCYVDIKTGKAEPWAALQTAAQSLLNDFDVDFETEEHKYTYKGKRLPSITQILKAEGFIDDTWYNDWARDKGSHVHAAVHYDILGTLDEDDLDPEIVPYLKAFRKFMKESGFKVEKSEVPGVNTVYGFAGTPDMVGNFPSPTPVRRFALELNKNAKYKLIPHVNSGDFGVFLAAVAIWKWKENNGYHK